MERRWVAVIIGALGLYFLVNAGLVGVGMYEFHCAFQQPPLRGVQPTEEEQQVGRYLLASVVVFVFLGASSIAACIGFLRRSLWAKPLWLLTSVAALSAIVVAIATLNPDRMQLVYVAGVVAVAWWALWHLERKERRGA